MTSGHGNGYDGTTSSDLLTVVSNQLHIRRTAEIGEWQAIVAWAENNLHEGVDERHVDDVVAALDTGAQLAGEGSAAVDDAIADPWATEGTAWVGSCPDSVSQGADVDDRGADGADAGDDGQEGTADICASN